MATVALTIILIGILMLLVGLACLYVGRDARERTEWFPATLAMWIGLIAGPLMIIAGIILH